MNNVETRIKKRHEVKEQFHDPNHPHSLRRPFPIASLPHTRCDVHTVVNLEVKRAMEILCEMMPRAGLGRRLR